MNAQPRADVSVIIVNWNAAEFLPQCLNALRLQTLQPERIIVVDNSSTDNSREIVAANPDVELIALETNTGFAYANNFAISHCKTKWVALLNPDAFPHESWLENLMRQTEFLPNLAALGSQQLMAGHPGVLDGNGDAMHFSGLVWRRDHGCQNFCLGQQAHVVKPVFSVCAAAALYRRDVFMQIGGFDDDFFCYIEDVDLGFRLRLAGFEAVQVIDAIVMHVGSALTGGRRSDFSVYYGQRNLFWVYLKNMPGFLFWFFLPLHLLVQLGSVLRFCVTGHCKTVVLAKWDAVRDLPTIWKKRQTIQKSRIASTVMIWRVLDKHLIPKRCR